MARIACIVSCVCIASSAVASASELRVLAAPIQVSGSNATRVLVGARPANGPAPTAACADSIVDQATGTSCLDASTTPTLGLLYPVSVSLFVALTGEVGIGTTSPAATLDVAGTARVSDTLTLNPSGDQALDVSTGSIYKSGARFIHTDAGIENTAVGFSTLATSTGGTANTAFGYRALATMEGTDNTAVGTRALSECTFSFGNTAVGKNALQYGDGGGNVAVGLHAMRFGGDGGFNVAVGIDALLNNATGSNNTASGTAVLIDNTTGSSNVAYGADALHDNLTGDENTSVGAAALGGNTNGSRNIAIGYAAGIDLTTGSNNIAIGNPGVAAESATIRVGTTGTHTRTFVAGVRSVTTGMANGVTVLVDSNGQLGTVSSSRRAKTDIADMGERTRALLDLRPVVFHYTAAQALPEGGDAPFEYGLIAEEVAEIFPDLVVRDAEGRAETVKYHMMSAMLLNELQAQVRELDALRGEVALLRGLEARLAAIESRAAAVDANAESRRPISRH